MEIRWTPAVLGLHVLPAAGRQQPAVRGQRDFRDRLLMRREPCELGARQGVPEEHQATVLPSRPTIGAIGLDPAYGSMT